MASDPTEQDREQAKKLLDALLVHFSRSDVRLVSAALAAARAEGKAEGDREGYQRGMKRGGREDFAEGESYARREICSFIRTVYPEVAIIAAQIEQNAADNARAEAEALEREAGGTYGPQRR